MNKHQLIELFRKWRDEEDNAKIIATVLALPESSVDDEILSWLAQAYIDMEEYKRAIAVLESLRERMENDYKWQFMMGLALLRAADDDECYDDDDLRRNILERAKVCFARGMNMNPPDDVLDSADRFMEELEGMLDELNGGEEEDFDNDVEMYDEDEADAVEDHIKEYFGEFPTVFHEITSRDIVCDIACIPPTEERNYFTLVTIGMGAHIMNIPGSLPADENGRAELLICLPPEWKLGESSEEWFWPISLLKDLAKLPINTDSWLGWGHSVDHRANLSSNTNFCASLLLYPEGVPEEAEACTLPSGDKVNFFEVIPMYREEMNFKVAHDTKALLERMKGVSHVVDINRPNSCENCDDDDPNGYIDSAKMHNRKIDEKELPIDKINGCNHIAVFMRWCIEHDLIAPEFYEHCGDVVKGVKDGSQTDIREFIMDYFGGCLAPFQLSYMGACFASYYYDWDDDDAEHFFPSDVDDCAEHYFGTERYNSEEFKDEAYMFVPFDEEYYQNLSKYIDRAFSDFLPTFIEYCKNNDEKAVKEARELLGTEIVLPTYEDFKNPFRAAEYNAKASGFTALPLLIDEGRVFTAEELNDVLLGATDTYSTTLSIVKFPTAEPIAWAENNLTGAKPYAIQANERTLSLKSCLEDMLGAAPAILTRHGELTSLLLPLEDGGYLRFEK
ncbi:MAG: suppressor of fused domain protein [Oscillospiraceae bacterium]|nr:suppressor of fused domain protein [Oscillospiraceae bacterium]